MKVGKKRMAVLMRLLSVEAGHYLGLSSKDCAIAEDCAKRGWATFILGGPASCRQKCWRLTELGRSVVGKQFSIGRAIAIILLLLAAPAHAEVLGIWCAPEDDCTAAIVAEFDKATKSIKVSMYNFTSPPIADALIRAHGRGVKVTLLLDKRAQSTRYSQAARCKAAGIAVLTDGKHPIHHVKERIIDDQRVLFGSFNDSRQANRNREDLVLDNTPKLVKRFADEFARHLKHAEAM